MYEKRDDDNLSDSKETLHRSTEGVVTATLLQYNPGITVTFGTVIL